MSIKQCEYDEKLVTDNLGLINLMIKKSNRNRNTNSTTNR